MLGAELKQIRERRGLTLAQCAEYTGVSASALKAIENGSRYPSLSTLEKAAECLNVNIVIGPRETIIEPAD